MLAANETKRQALPLHPQSPNEKPHDTSLHFDLASGTVPRRALTVARNDGVASAWAEARALLEALPRLVSGRVHLLTLELRRAGGALVMILAFGIGAVLMLATAWLAMWVALAAALAEHGLGWGWSVLIVALINLGGALALLLKVRSLGKLLGLPATVRRLGVVGATAAAARDAPAPHEVHISPLPPAATPARPSPR